MIKVATTSATLRNNIHTTILNLLKGDTNITANATYGTSNFYDGRPYDVTRTGFPYVIIRTPSIVSRRVTQTKFERVALVRINVVSQKESVVRQLADAISNSLETNQETTKLQNMYWAKIDSDDPTPSSLPTSNQEKDIGIWTLTLTAEYRLRVS